MADRRDIIKDLNTPGKHAMGGVAGLYLFVAPSGSKLWRLKYMLNGKEGLLSIGAWPVVSYEEAVATAQAAKRDVAKGVKPLGRYRAVPGKRCTRCGVVRETKDFYGSKRTKDKLSSWCKPCLREYSADKQREKAMAKMIAPEPERVVYEETSGWGVVPAWMFAVSLFANGCFAVAYVILAVAK